MGGSMSLKGTDGKIYQNALQLGDKVIVPLPASIEDAEARMGEGYKCVDWYFCKKQL
jgi:hypothetical protein